MPKKNSGLSWIKKAEPKFIREFKERIAYKEQASIETKKKKLDSDVIVEREDERPQVIQLKSGDLGEKEYTELRDKEDIQNSASSFGKILFKRPSKKATIEESQTEVEPSTSSETASETESIKKTEIDLIFNLNEKGVEEEPDKEGETDEPVVTIKKIFLDIDEKKDDSDKKFGLQPPAKKRFIDGPTSKTTSLPASKVLAREAKSGNKKLLSFYDEEQEEIEEFNQEHFKEKLEKERKREEEEDSD